MSAVYSQRESGGVYFLGLKADEGINFSHIAGGGAHIYCLKSFCLVNKSIKIFIAFNIKTMYSKHHPVSTTVQYLNVVFSHHI